MLERGFASRMEEGGSGLLWMGARHYDPSTGTFLQPDPMGIQVGNPYAYARNNPTRFWDPTGLQAGAISANALGTSFNTVPSIATGSSTNLTSYADWGGLFGNGSSGISASDFGSSALGYASGSLGPNAQYVSSAGSQPAPTPTDPVGIDVGVGAGEIAVGQTSEGEPYALVTTALAGGSLGVAPTFSNPPGFLVSRAVASGPANVITLSAVYKLDFRWGPITGTLSYNIGVNLVNVTTDTNAYTVPRFFLDPEGSFTFNKEFPAQLKVTDLFGLEAGAFKLR